MNTRALPSPATGTTTRNASTTTRTEDAAVSDATLTTWTSHLPLAAILNTIHPASRLLLPLVEVIGEQLVEVMEAHLVVEITPRAAQGEEVAVDMEVARITLAAARGVKVAAAAEAPNP